MKRVSKTLHYAFDKEEEPIESVSIGEEIDIETYDARGGRLQEPTDVFSSAPDHSREFPECNPVTGPVLVTNSQPGDILCLTIKDIRVGERGWLVLRPDMGVLKGVVDHPVAKVVEVSANEFIFEGMRIPIAPMVGTIGTSPRGQPISTYYAGPHGGNMDNSQVAIGSTIYLPVFVAGSLFSMGDVHARMGDGEVGTTGIEVSANVTVRVDLLKKGELDIPLPFVENRNVWITTSYANTCEEAICGVVKRMSDFLSSKLRVGLDEAVMLISAMGNIRICQASVDFVTMRLEFPKLERT